jgi:hypothetical protein
VNAKEKQCNSYKVRTKPGKTLSIADCVNPGPAETFSAPGIKLGSTIST